MNPLPDLPALAAWLLGGRDGRLPPPEARADVHAELPAFARARRLSGELAASERLEEAGLPRETARALAVDREAARALAAPREAALERAGLALASAGLVALPYKGAAVVALTHGDPSRRPMGDLDLVIPPEARAPARAALLDAGFVATNADTRLHDVLLDPRAAGPGHPRGVAIEVHVDLFPPPHPFALDLPGCFARSRPWKPGLALPETADALLACVFHLALYETDSRKTWLGLRDVALLARAGLGAWAGGFPGELAERAETWDLAPVVAAVLARATDWAGAPPVVAEAFAPPPATSWRRRAYLRASFAELDRTFAAGRELPPRELALRVAAAAWQPTLGGAVAYALLRLLGRGGVARRLVRYARAGARGLSSDRGGRG